MGCKRKIWFSKAGKTLEFNSFSDARRYFGVKTGNFPAFCVKSGWYKGWKVEAAETPYHGMYKSSLYGSWAAMKTRCTNSNIPEWNHYGGRGIKLCDEWMEFIPFMKWAKANGYKEGLTIERIDVNGNYCPENCCWITRAEQQKNKRNSLVYEVEGERKTLTDLSKENNISLTTVKHRLDFGWSVEDALAKARKKWPSSKEITFNGETLSARKWAERTGINASCITKRIDHGWTVEDALSTPPDLKNRKQVKKIAWRKLKEEKK